MLSVKRDQKQIHVYENPLIPYLDQHDVIVKQPLFVLVVLDNQGDIELLLKAILLVDAVLSQDHLDHITPKKKNVGKGELISYRCVNLMLITLLLYEKKSFQTLF